MVEPSLYSRVQDSLAVGLSGGVRLRFFLSGETIAVKTYGNASKTPAELVIRTVHEIANGKTGTIDLRRQNRTWKITVAGELAEDGTEQRLRNVIVNS